MGSKAQSMLKDSALACVSLSTSCSGVLHLGEEIIEIVLIAQLPELVVTVRARLLLSVELRLLSLLQVRLEAVGAIERRRPVFLAR